MVFDVSEVEGIGEYEVEGGSEELSKSALSEPSIARQGQNNIISPCEDFGAPKQANHPKSSLGADVILTGESKSSERADLESSPNVQRQSGGDVVYRVPEGRVFLVVRGGTVEVRTDYNLRKLLTSKYESVMESRYFGKGGVEVVLSGQLSEDEVYDLVRLSYNLSKS